MSENTNETQNIQNTPEVKPVQPAPAENPVAKPVTPVAETKAPEIKPGQSAETPVAKPVTPVTETKTPEVKPIQPTETPAAKPVTPSAETKVPEVKTAQTAETPAAKPATPVVETKTPEVKTVQPAPAETPVAKPVTPVAETKTPEVKPIQPTETPAAKPATPEVETKTPEEKTVQVTEKSDLVVKEPEIAVELNNVGIRFNLGREKIDSLKEYVIKLLHHQVKYDEFWALKNVSFKLNKGDRLGILGLNGAGKSTLLKIIAGVYRPTTGSVMKKGILAPLLELGAGFDTEYSARENIYLYGAILGYSKKFIQSKFDEIIQFSELEQFVDVPLKNFSSGMRSRLGFAVCTLVEPDILILDEVLSVGDARFQQKSLQKVMNMFNKGVTVLFVSHSLAQVKKLCNKALILNKGEMIKFGDIDDVAPVYEQILKQGNQF